MDDTRREKNKRYEEKLRRELSAVICRALDDTKVVEIMLNPDGRFLIERLGEVMECAGEMSPAQAELAMTTVAASVNTTITAQNPFLECELLLDGSRFEALTPPMVNGSAFTSWRYKATLAWTKPDCLRMAQELKGEWQRTGLEVRPPVDGGGTVGELMPRRDFDDFGELGGGSGGSSGKLAKSVKQSEREQGELFECAPQPFPDRAGTALHARVRGTSSVAQPRKLAADPTGEGRS